MKIALFCFFFQVASRPGQRIRVAHLYFMSGELPYLPLLDATATSHIDHCYRQTQQACDIHETSIPNSPCELSAQAWCPLSRMDRIEEKNLIKSRLRFLSLFGLYFHLFIQWELRKIVKSCVHIVYKESKPKFLHFIIIYAIYSLILFVITNQ